jgi:hypothetical protein
MPTATRVLADTRMARLACVPSRPRNNLHALGVDDKIIQAILRHSNVGEHLREERERVATQHAGFTQRKIGIVQRACNG